MEGKLIDKDTLTKEIKKAKYLLDFQRESIIELIEKHPWTTEEEGVIDRVLFRLLGIHVKDLSTNEQKEVEYAVQDIR